MKKVIIYLLMFLVIASFAASEAIAKSELYTLSKHVRDFGGFVPLAVLLFMAIKLDGKQCRNWLLLVGCAVILKGSVWDISWNVARDLTSDLNVPWNYIGDTPKYWVAFRHFIYGLYPLYVVICIIASASCINLLEDKT